MKTFQEFILECELVEGKVEWDNPNRPLQSGLTPREKNRAVRKRLGIENPNTDSFFKGGPSERDYERYGKLQAAHEKEKGTKVPKEKLHKFKSVAKGRLGGEYSAGRIRRMAGVHKGAGEGRSAEKGTGSHSMMSQVQGGKERREKNIKRYGDYADLKRLKEPKESYDYFIDEGKVEWDNPKRPLQSGFTPREKNRAKRRFLDIERPERLDIFDEPTTRRYERYGKLQIAHNKEKDKKVPKNKIHKFKKNDQGKTKGQMKRSFGSHKMLIKSPNMLKHDIYQSSLKEPN